MSARKSSPSSGDVRQRKPQPWAAAGARAAGNSVVGISAAGKRWWGASASLLGMLLVWSLLQPVDAISVFQGTAIPQNLGWLLLATLTAAGSIACGVRYPFSSRSWCVVGAGLTWLLIATVLAGRENNPRVAWNGFWQVIALGACYYAASALLPGPRSRLAALQIVLVGCVALALQGLDQVFIEMPAERAEYLADPEAFLAQDPDLNLRPGSPMRKRFEDRLLYSTEPYATFALTNSLAVLLSGGLIVLGGLGVVGWRRQLELQPGDPASLSAPSARKQPGLRRWLPLLALSLAVLVVGLCWFLTRSRVAYLAVGLGGVAWLLNVGLLGSSSGEGSAGKQRYRSGRLLVALLVGGGILVAAGGLWLWRNDRLVFSEATKSLSYRLEYWLATLDMLRDHGLWGVGLGNFQSYYPIYKLPTASEIIADPHNWPLDLCVSLSLPVGLVLIGWLGLRLLGAGRGLENSELLQPLPIVDVLDEWSRRCLLWGAGLGGALCMGMLGLLAGQDVAVLAVVWLASAGLIGLLQPLLNVDQALLSGTLRAALLTMLTCLLASGSWQASGLAVPFLIGLVAAGERRLSGWSRSSTGADGRSGSQPEELPTTARVRFAQVAIVALPAVGLLCFLVQCWRPTTTSWSLLQQAQLAQAARPQLALIDAAVAADELDTEPLRWRAQMLGGQATLMAGDRFVPLADQALDAFDAWLARDSTKSLNWELAGKHALELAGKAQQLGLRPQKWLEAALGYYERAVARYPSNIGLRAQLAATLGIAERWSEAEQEWQIALQLDQATLHEDRKLASQQLWLPLLPAGAAADATSGFVEQQPWIMAEPMLDWLRTHSPGQSE